MFRQVWPFCLNDIREFVRWFSSVAVLCSLVFGTGNAAIAAVSSNSSVVNPNDPAIQLIAQGVSAALANQDPSALAPTYLHAYRALQVEPGASQTTELYVERRALFAIETEPVGTRSVALQAFAARISRDPRAIPERLQLAHLALEASWRLYVEAHYRTPTSQAPFLTSMAADQGHHIWIGTEDGGLWQFNPLKNGWKQFTTKNGLGNMSVYAVACDKLGRIWAGTLNHGVWVYNGHESQTIDGKSGLLGQRVFAITTCPTDGDVWIATEAGLTRYSLSRDTWTHYTTIDGLPSDQVTAVAFDRKGNVYVGTACDGIAMALAQSNYHHWRVVQGPKQESDLPNTTTGKGLPSNLINCLLVSRAGDVYAGTPDGLGISSDRGKTWRYLRGADWVDKVQGEAPSGKPAKLPRAAGPTISEDWVTSLAEDSSGNILIGHRTAGLEVYTRGALAGDRSAKLWLTSACPAYVSALLPSGNRLVYVGSYGNGLSAACRELVRGVAWPTPLEGRATRDTSSQNPALPSPAGPPTLAQMNDMLGVLDKVAPAMNGKPSRVIPLADDWQTEGEWLGRYGRYWACLCAMQDPGDYVWGAGPLKVDYKAIIGPNHDPNDLLRSWTEWASTDLNRALEMPPVLAKAEVQAERTTWDKDRRCSQWDDHGELYAPTLDGPHIYCTIKVPTGLFYLSLYEFNDDAHIGPNVYRDWRISIREHKAKDLLDISDFDKEPELAHARVNFFSGGVWKRFLVQGPIDLTVKIDRNHSYNTNMSAITLDLVDEQPPLYYRTASQWFGDKVIENRKRASLIAAWRATHKPGISVPFIPASSQADAADRIMGKLDELRLTNAPWWATNGRRFYEVLLPRFEQAAKQGISNKAGRMERAYLGTCCYQTDRYIEWEECQSALGIVPARQIELSLRHRDPSKIPSSGGKPWQPVIVHSQANN